MMHYLYDTFAYIVFCFLGGAFDTNDKQSHSATVSSEKYSYPSPVHGSHSNESHENHDDSELKTQREQPVVLGGNFRTQDSLIKVTSRNGNEHNEEFKTLDIVMNNNNEESKCINIDASKSDHEHSYTLKNAPEGSYAAYLAQCGEVPQTHDVYLWSSDDEESVQSDDSIIESPPVNQPETESGALTGMNEKNEESRYTNINTSKNNHGYRDSFVNAPEGSYAAYLAERDEIPKAQSVHLYSSDDEESVESDDSSILASQSAYERKTELENFQTPQFPTLKDIESPCDFYLPLKAGPMPRLCTYCFRWEDQPDDKYEEKDMVSDKWFMIGNVVFFRKLKPFWAQCSACGFGMSRKDVCGRKINRVKKLLCKMSGREYKGYEFKRFGYEWMSEEGRNKGLSAYM